MVAARAATGSISHVEDPDSVLKQLGRRMAELRAEAKLTQGEVAKGIETAVQNYQRIEYGLQNVTIRTLVKIAGVLGVRVALLFERSTDARRRVRRTQS